MWRPHKTYQKHKGSGIQLEAGWCHGLGHALVPQVDPGYYKPQTDWHTALHLKQSTQQSGLSLL